MTGRLNIACVFGTRPEAIKMAPVIHALARSEWGTCTVINTGQHRELVDQALSLFDVSPDIDLALMQPGQAPLDFLSRLLPALDRILSERKICAVLAQGDTASVFGAALSAFHRRIPFGHVEAGLRTGDLAEPFPEEAYRQMVARLAFWHFAPTQRASENLRKEDIPQHQIFLTGNTGIDALLYSAARLPQTVSRPKRSILVTVHRGENFGAPLNSIFQALLRIVELHRDTEIVYPVHPNPKVKLPAHEMLGNHPRIRLLPPQGYFDFVRLMREATLILTDSGGIQEEAPSLGKPVLVLRNRTERPEGIEAGVSRLAGTASDTIVRSVTELLSDQKAYQAMSKAASPYGDGKAAKRIVSVLQKTLVDQKL